MMDLMCSLSELSSWITKNDPAMSAPSNMHIKFHVPSKNNTISLIIQVIFVFARPHHKYYILHSNTCF